MLALTTIILQLRINVMFLRANSAKVLLVAAGFNFFSLGQRAAYGCRFEPVNSRSACEVGHEAKPERYFLCDLSVFARAVFNFYELGRLTALRAGRQGMENRAPTISVTTEGTPGIMDHCSSVALFILRKYSNSMIAGNKRYCQPR
jgi:hypothetical protein